MCNTINIHIKATCPYFEIYEIIPENKAVRRLEKILSHFQYYDTKVTTRKDGAKLIVNTGVHNPELPLKY